ncbi:TonB family protein [Collimonas sp. NPDC087041]|uniref:TonB family protein n=1 Tax=Collimonas sp. NPDC087041 TaxID=3363960 RepID=UPI003808BA49
MEKSASILITEERGEWASIVLAMAVHALLLALLWFGVCWKSSRLESVDAEIWSSAPDENAPAESRQSELTTTILRPAMASITVSPETSYAVIEPQNNQIAAVSSGDGNVAKLSRENPVVSIPQLPSDAAVNQRQAQAKMMPTQADQGMTEPAQTQVVAQPPTDSYKQIASDDAVSDQDVRVADPDVGTANSPPAKLQEAPDNADWMARVKAMIAANTLYETSAADRESNSRVVFAVSLLPDGSVSGMTLTKTSGNPEFDEAVRSAIEKSQPYPVDNSGQVPQNFESISGPRDVRPKPPPG